MKEMSKAERRALQEAQRAAKAAAAGGKGSGAAAGGKAGGAAAGGGKLQKQGSGNNLAQQGGRPGRQSSSVKEEAGKAGDAQQVGRLLHGWDLR